MILALIIQLIAFVIAFKIKKVQTKDKENGEVEIGDAPKFEDLNDNMDSEYRL